jgi:hypothetical protein
MNDPTELIIGYGPVINWYPHVPEFIILQTSTKIIKYSQNGDTLDLTPKLFDDMVSGKQIRLLSKNVEYTNGEWVAIESGSPILIVKIELDKIQKWIIDRATKMINESSKQNPLRSLSTLDIAAKLCGIKLAELTRTLESKRFKSESMEDTLKRIKSELNN